MSAADRKLLWIAGSLFAVLAILLVLSAPTNAEGPALIPSTYASGPGGARAAFLLLQELGLPAQRWEEPPFRLAALGRNVTLVLAEPSDRPSHAEQRALRQFVQNGGRLLFCGLALPDFFPGVQLKTLRTTPSFLPSAVGIQRFGPAFPAAASQDIEIRPDALWRKFNSSQLAVYGQRDRAVVAAWAIGAGEVVWWASATPLSNDQIRHAGNLPLFLASVAFGPGRTILWDEYFHGERGSLWSYVGRPPALRWAALQLVLLAGAAFFAFSRRSGPVIAPEPASRLSPLEFVDMMGGFYRRAKAAPVAVEVRYRRLRFELTRRLGLPGDTPDATLAQTAASRLGWDRAQLSELLDQARQVSSARRTSSGRALPLGRQLQDFANRLEIRRPAHPSEEKTD